MHHTEVAIIGGGLAGSTAAAMLGRAGISSVLIDPHLIYPPDFRSEKLVDSQLPLLEKTGIAGAVTRCATEEQEVWIARFGHLVEKRRHRQRNILYDTLVNLVRAEIPECTAFVHGKARALSLGPDRQQITLTDGSEISARLVILANGLNVGLRQEIGMRHEVLSACHSISIGFDVKPVSRSGFDFPALTYYSEQPSSRVAYLTLFAIGSAMRANLFVYRDISDPWLRQFRDSPRETLFTALPGLRKLVGAIEVADNIKIRPIDLYVTKAHRQPGIVLVGDAFATSCPAAGTGVHKVLTDVERLCNVHIPGWLAAPGMQEEKISAFYADETKAACDAHSLAKAYYMRSLSIDPGLPWQARRLSRYIAQRGIGMYRRARAGMIDRLAPAR